MSDTEDDFDEAFRGFGEDTPPTAVTPPTDPVTPPVAPGAAAEPPKDELPKVELPKPAEEPKKDEKPVETPKETPPAPAADEKKPEDGAKPPETPETPAPEAPQPLTKDDVKSVVTDLLNGERSSSKVLETTTKEVLDAYYPEGLSNTLTAAKTGKELKTPADVVEASDGKMSTEEAAQWLMNEQFALDKSVADIKKDAEKIAETTVNFKRDAITAVQKYEPLFTKYPTLQRKVFDLMMKQVKADEKKGVILAAPDVMDLYDTYLEPYQQAYEYATKESATNPVTPPAAPEPPKPGAEDRLDEPGDGGSSGEVDDPNDFAQQVKKELAKEL
jgi:hypothetical protein